MDKGSGGATWLITKLPSILYTGTQPWREKCFDGKALYTYV